jgi:large subunit ribosomal protein L10
MALTKDQKQEVIDKVGSLLDTSKMTVVARYQGTDVKSLQQLRNNARENGTVIQVLKNRLVIKALSDKETFSDTDVSELKGQLLYAFNAEDEVASAQVLADFAKKQPSIEFVGAIRDDGTFIGADEVKTLATLPSKSELLAQVIATLGSPLNDVTSALSGDLHSLLDGVEAKATS